MTQLVTMMLGDTEIGIDVGTVEDVVRLGRVTRVPLAAPWIAGVMNLRGHVVTAIDLRTRLGMPPAPQGVRPKCVVVSIGGDSFGLIVDAVDEVINVDAADCRRCPATLDERWRQVSSCIVQREGGLLVELDIGKIITPDRFFMAA